MQDWEEKLTALGQCPPPIDDQDVAFIQRGLRQASTTRFLLNAARHPSWPMWLYGHGHLAGVFEDNWGDEPTQALGHWLAQTYARDHAPVLLHLLARAGARLGTRLWFEICAALADDKERHVEPRAWRLLTQLLLGAIPDWVDVGQSLSGLARRARRQGDAHVLVEIFLALCQHRLRLAPQEAWCDEKDSDSETKVQPRLEPLCDHFTLNQVWDGCVRPSLAAIADPLLRGLGLVIGNVHRLEATQWGFGPTEMPPGLSEREAVESAERNWDPQPIDVMTDAARDALAHLAQTGSPALMGWIDAWIHADTPLLRRLAIHAMAEHPAQSADQRLHWLLGRCGLHGTHEHH